MPGPSKLDVVWQAISLHMNRGRFDQPGIFYELQLVKRNLVFALSSLGTSSFQEIGAGAALFDQSAASLGRLGEAL